MASTSLRSSFVGGMPSAGISKLGQPRTRSGLHLRVAAEGASGTMLGSEGNVMKPDGEMSRLIGTGMEKQDELWWAPLFNVSSEEQWSNLMTKRSKNETDPKMSSTSSLPWASASKSTIALPDLIDSAKHERRSNSTKVAFTAEKAKAMRKSMRAAETWHDGWYHSAIATRLAEPTD